MVFLWWGNWLARLVIWVENAIKPFPYLKIVAILNPTLLRHTLNMQCSSQFIIETFQKRKKESTKRIDVFCTRQESCKLKNSPLNTIFNKDSVSLRTYTTKATVFLFFPHMLPFYYSVIRFIMIPWCFSLCCLPELLSLENQYLSIYILFFFNSTTL